jgi:hypothetical protein
VYHTLATFKLPVIIFGGTRKRGWLRHYATSWKIVGSIPDEIVGFFD